MWYPLAIERLTLSTRLGPDECSRRLLHTTGHWLALIQGDLPVRGFVRGRWFYLGGRTHTLALLRTWISGQIRRADETTVIDVRIGPNRVAGVFLAVLGALLGAGAAELTVLAFTSPFETWTRAALSWAVVIAFIAVFFVFPAEGRAGERAYLLDHVKKALEATEEPHDAA